jgi:subtilisin family serine protease
VKKWLRVSSLLFVFLLLAANLAVAAPKDQSRSYLVSLVPGASAESIVGPGVTLVSDWSDIQAAQVMTTPSGAALLAKNPSVEYVEEDFPRKALSLPYADGDLTWGLQAVKAQEAWNLGATGQGIKVCVLDTGIDPNHPEFTRDGGSVIAGVENFTSSPTTFSVHPHGTHVSGTIAGQTNASGSKIGVAPGVDLYMAKVLGDDGYGETAWIINGLRWCQSQGANIASLSLGSDHASGVESKAFLDAWKSGMLIVAAAGNDENNRLSYPAGYEPVISVAAVDSKLQKASFSQWNSDVEVSAPGVATLSSVPVDTGLIIGVTEGGQSYAAGSVEFAPVPADSVTAPLVECGIADTTTSCTGKPASGQWTALISRGSISFAQKVTNVMAQGATAAIIANNDKANPDDVGSFTLGAEGAWIPTVSVSYNSGAAIRAGGLGEGTVTFTPWNYAYMQGTSMATPHAAAVAALAWSANPGLTNQQMRDILDGTALHLGKEHGRNFQYGYGLVQADAAVQAALAH